MLSVLTLAGLVAGTLLVAWQGQQLAERTEQQLDALVTLGERDLQAGRFDAAIASLSAALALRPKDARAGELLLQAKVGQLLTTAKANDSPDNAAAALQALDKLLELDPEQAEARALKVSDELAGMLYLSTMRQAQKALDIDDRAEVGRLIDQLQPRPGVRDPRGRAGR